MWIALALLFPALGAVSNIVDKLVVDRHAPGIYRYAFWMGTFEGSLGLITFGVAVLWGPELRSILGGMAVGAISGVSLILLLFAFKRGQAARLVPIWYLNPLIVAPLAAGLLGESLSGQASLGIVLAVSGAVLVSWQGASEAGRFGDHTALALALAAAVVVAGGTVLSKHILEGEGNFWQFVAMLRVGFALAMAGVLLMPDVRRGAPPMVRNREFMRLLCLTEGAVTISIPVRFAAISLGPVSLVSALNSTLPMLLFFYVLGLRRLYPSRFEGWLTRGTLWPQFAGISAITAAVAIISLD